MPVPCTAVDFLDLVRKSGLVEPVALDAFAWRLADDPRAPAAPKPLAVRMIAEGLLTELQAVHLLKGKWRNFLICGKYKILEHLGTGGRILMATRRRMRACSHR